MVLRYDVTLAGRPWIKVEAGDAIQQTRLDALIRDGQLDIFEAAMSILGIARCFGDWSWGRVTGLSKPL